MRIIIYGAGAVGCVIGGHLARTRHDVLLIGRSGHIKAINENGLRLTTPTGTYVLQIPAVIEPHLVNFREDDVICLCMKSQNTEHAIRDLRAVIKDIPIFCFQNGLRNEETAAQYFLKVYSVMVRMGAMYLTDGEVIARQDPPGLFVIGGYPAGSDELVESIALKLRTAGFLVQTTADIMPYKWGKLMDNIANAIDAITDSRWDEIIPIARLAQEELRDLLIRADISWISREELIRKCPELNAPTRGSLDIEARSSTWQSLARKQGTVETEYLNGEVVRLARKLGLQSPINEMLLKLSQDIAKSRQPPGKYSVNQLCALLGLT